MTCLGATFVIPKSALDLWVLAGPTTLPKGRREAEERERRDLVSQRAPGVIAEVDRVHAILAPTGADLERLLLKVHRQSVIAPKQARKSHAKLRAELHRRLDEGKRWSSTGTRSSSRRSRRGS